MLGMIFGAMAGLGTITPASDFVLPWHDLVIGLAAGAVCFYACPWLKLSLRSRDDRKSYQIIMRLDLPGFFGHGRSNAAQIGPTNLGPRSV